MITEQELTAQVDQNLDYQLAELRDMVAIPSVSSDPTKAAEMTRSAERVEQAFAELGLNTSIRRARTDQGQLGQPAVVATGPKVEGAPRVLLYAHHDVQPTGDPDRWATPPFEMTIKGDRIYGRGTSDDGAGVVVHLGALAAFQGDLPVNVTVFIEGEEEVGSPSFVNFLNENKETLEADVIIVADSGNWTVDIPALTASLRGVATIDVNLRVLDHAVHSGFFGGPVLDAVTLASRMIASLHDEKGDVAVPGLGGSGTAEVVWEEDAFRVDASAVPGLELAGTGDLAARIWTKPALNVIGLDATSVADAANAIIPECNFRLSLRVVPGEDPAKSAQKVIDYLHSQQPFGAEVTTKVVETGPAYIADLDQPAVESLKRALETAWQEAPVAIGQGGSIPFIADFQRVFPEATVLVTGVEDPATNAHAEDESQSLKVLRNATLAEALLLADLGNQLGRG